MDIKSDIFNGRRHAIEGWKGTARTCLLAFFFFFFWKGSGEKDSESEFRNRRVERVGETLLIISNSSRPVFEKRKRRERVLRKRKGANPRLEIRRNARTYTPR